MKYTVKLTKEDLSQIEEMVEQSMLLKQCGFAVTGQPMRDIVLNNGETMTDAEFIQERGMGDTTTTFIPTKADLKLLAKALVDAMLNEEYLLELCADMNWIARRDYAEFRLGRVLSFLPEMEAEVEELIRVGREKVKKDAAEAQEESRKKWEGK